MVDLFSVLYVALGDIDTMISLSINDVYYQNSNVAKFLYYVINPDLFNKMYWIHKFTIYVGLTAVKTP